MLKNDYSKIIMDKHVPKYDPSVGIDYNLQDVILCWAMLNDLSATVGSAVSDLSSISTLPGVSDNGEYTKALKCVTGKGIGKGFQDWADRANNKAVSLRNSILIQQGISVEAFNLAFGNKDASFFEMLYSDDFAELLELNGEELETKINDLDPAIKEMIKAIVNGVGIGVVDPKTLGAIVSSGILGYTATTIVTLVMGSLISGSTGSPFGSNFADFDWAEIAKKAIYVVQNGVGVEGKLKYALEKVLQTLVAGSPEEAAISRLDLTVFSNAAGVMALFVVNSVIDAIATGDIKGGMVDRAPEHMLESLIWILVSGCTANPILGNVAASVISRAATAVFADENGNVDQNWAAFAAVMTELGAVGAYSAEAAAVVSPLAGGVSMSAVTGWGLLGFLLVVGIYQGVQEFKDSYQQLQDTRAQEEVYLSIAYGISVEESKELLSYYTEALHHNKTPEAAWAAAKEKYFSEHENEAYENERQGEYHAYR